MASSNLLEDAELAHDKFSTLEMQLVKDTEELFKRQVEHLRCIDQLHARRPNMTKINHEIKRLSSLIDSSSNLVEEVCNKFSRIDLAKSRLQECISKISDIHDLRSCKIGVIQAMDRDLYEEAAMHIKRYLAIDQTDLLRTTSLICGQSSADQSKPSELTQLDATHSYYVLSVKTMNETMIELDAARSKLLTLCQDKFTKAIAQNDTRNVDRFFKIFPMLGEHKDGLVRYSDYMKKKIVTPEITQTLKSSEKSQADKLGSLYEGIAKLIDTHQPLIETYYGPGHMIIVIRILLNECDRLSRRILEEFRDVRRLQHVTKAIQRASNPRMAPLQGATSTTSTSTTGSNVANPSLGPSIGPVLGAAAATVVANPLPVNTTMSVTGVSSSLNINTSTSNNATYANNPGNHHINVTLPVDLDPRNIDGILNEMSLIISRSEVYLNFLVQRLEEEVKFRADNESQRSSALIEIYQLITIECEVNYLIQELGGIHVLLERFYLEESSQIAIRTDELDSHSFTYYVSSVLDDIFFIIKKCTKRAISTKSNEVFCATLNHCVHMLDTTFCQFLEDKLKNQQYYSTASFTSKNLDLSQAYSVAALQTSRYLQRSNEFELSKGHFFSALNNLDRASDYIQTLRGILDGDLKKLRSPRLSILLPINKQSSQIEKSITCLNELSQLSSKFASIVNSGLYQLFNATLKNRIKTELRTILNENPTLGQEISKNPDELVRLARDLLVIVDKTLATNLTPENYSRLISITRYTLAFYLKSPTSN